MDNIFGIDSHIPFKKALPIGLQHVLVMFVANITPIIILAGIMDFSPEFKASLVQNAMLIAGIGTSIQLFPLWKIGSRLPIVMGVSFTFLSVAIGVSTSLGYGTMMCAVIIGGIVEGLIGLFAKYWVRFITPVIAATIVTAIGFSLLPIGANSFAGGEGAADFGSARNLIVGTVTLISCLVFRLFTKGFYQAVSFFFGLIVGYILSIFMGMVDFSALSGCKLFSLPMIPMLDPDFHLQFNLGAVLSFIVIFLVSATETIGDTTVVVTSGLDREPSSKEISGALACDGFISSLSGVLGCTPITSFSQNAGLMKVTGVFNRRAIGVGAAIMILAGLFPAFGALLCTVPQCVLGGCTIMMFGSIIMAGIEMLSRCEFNSHNTTVVTLSLAIGIGFPQANGMFSIFPQMFQEVFAQNSVAIVFVIALITDSIHRPKLSRKQQ